MERSERPIEKSAATIEQSGKSVIYTFVQAMVLLPEVQNKAQLASVPGNLVPGVEDIDKVPYIMCIMKETSGWLSTANMGAVV